MEIVEREATKAEFSQVKLGFSQHAAEHGNPDESADRVSFVASRDGAFVGYASGLAYKKATGYADWFYLTDLFVEKAFRRQGLGRKLLGRIEQKAEWMGIGYVWTWTAGYEAPDFYRSCGYEIFLEQTNYFTSGHSRVGLRKRLLIESKTPR